MKEREPSHPRDPSAKKERPSRAEPTDASGDRADAAELGPDQDQFESLGSTRVSSTPLGTGSEDALAERDPDAAAVAGDDTSSRRTRSTLGDFVLVRKLGQGAMATVYKARQLSFDRKVALKLLHKHVADNPKLVERFYREARIMGQLDHPNIVQGFGVGEVEGLHYFAMEYIAGANVQTWLNKLGRLPVGDALHVTIACAEALGYAHEHGMIHRDVKPDNVLITKQGLVKLADLGMVKAMDDDMALTQTGHAVGTPWYMPLEQAKNAKDVDGRSDIYALGCMFYYLLTGRPPFRGASIVEVIQAKEIGTFPPARQLNSEVPEKLDLIISGMTQKLAKNRYQNCREVINALESLNLTTPELTFLTQDEASRDTVTANAAAADTSLSGRLSTVTADEWYLQVKIGSGEFVVKKCTTAKLFRLLEAGQVNANAKVSRQKQTGFRSLATYKEFESVALALATRSGVDKQTNKFREMYKKVEEDGEKREQKKREVEKLDESIRHPLRGVMPQLQDIFQQYRTPLLIGGAIAGSIVLAAIIVKWLAGG